MKQTTQIKIGRYLLGTAALLLAATNASAQNNVTFQVDMSAQIQNSSWTPGQTITVSGSFNGWGNGDSLTNDPSQIGNASNVYSAVLSMADAVGTTENYKFRANGGWENPASTCGNNRTF